MTVFEFIAIRANSRQTWEAWDGDPAVLQQALDTVRRFSADRAPISDTPTDHGDSVTVTEAAELTGAPRRRIREDAQAGLIVGSQSAPGARRRVSVASVTAWAKQKGYTPQ